MWGTVTTNGVEIILKDRGFLINDEQIDNGVGVLDRQAS